MGLEHPALPRVLAFEPSEAGRLVLVRELFDDSLDGRLRVADRHMPPGDVEALLGALLDLLGYLERMVPPVVHRNIQPSTIMFRKPNSWDPVLVDFEIVAPPPGDTEPDTGVGNPAYAAPEQLAGGAVPASDRYALGRVMTFVAMHRDPSPDEAFAGSALELLPTSVHDVVRRLLDPKPDRRFDDAHAAAAALAEAVEKAREKVAGDALVKPEPPSHAAEHARSIAGALFRFVWKSLAVIGAITVIIGVILWLAVPTLSEPERKAKTCGSSAPGDCFDSGHAFAEGEGVTKDARRAAVLYGRGCELDNAGSCNNLARLEDDGEGVKKDVAHAVILYAKACRLGSDVGCRNLAISFLDGLGALEAPAMLERWLGLCKSDDELVVCGAAAQAFEQGVGTPVDPARAGEFYGKACQRGHARSCRTLAGWYRRGTFVPRDDRQALALLERACDHDDADGCIDAARTCRDGAGVPRDTRRAARLFRKACHDDSKAGCAELVALCSAGERSACPGAEPPADAGAD